MTVYSETRNDWELDRCKNYLGGLTLSQAAQKRKVKYLGVTLKVLMSTHIVNELVGSASFWTIMACRPNATV